MDFRNFCKEESEYLKNLKEYKEFLNRLDSRLKNNTNNEMKYNSKVNQSKMMEEKGFYGNPREPKKDDFQKFKIKTYDNFEPYMERSGAYSFCDKSDGKFCKDYISTQRSQIIPKRKVKPALPEHLMGRVKRKDSSSSSSSLSSSRTSKSSHKNTKNIMLYKVTIKTNESSDSGTRAPVFIRLVDKTNQSEPIGLKKKTGIHNFYFAPNSKEIFYFKSIKISELKSVNIKLDAKSDSDEWCLDWLRIEELIGEKRKWLCKMDRFLSNHRKNCKLMAKLTPELEKEMVIKYKIQVSVSQDSVDEFCGLLNIKIFGTNKQTGVLILHNYKSSNLKKGTTASFLIEHEEVGNINSICLGVISASKYQENENQSASSSDRKKKSQQISTRKGWEDIKIDSVIIEWVDSDNKWHGIEFSMNDWIGLSDKMSKKSIVLENPTKLKRYNKDFVAEDTTYDVTFCTSKSSLGGTDATVYIRFYGKYKFWSKTYEFVDYNKKRFERGAEDTFRVSGPNVGTITKIELWHNNKGIAAGWKLDKNLPLVKVTRQLTASEICEVLENMSKKSNLPKEMKVENGKLVINEDTVTIHQEKKNDKKVKPMKPKQNEAKKFPVDDDDLDLSDSNYDSDTYTIPAKEIVSTNKSLNQSLTQMFSLPYAETSQFNCKDWLSGKTKKQSNKPILLAENLNLLFSSINLKLVLEG